MTSLQKAKKQDLLQQFEQEPLGTGYCNETQWKKLLSEYTTVSDRKRHQLKSLMATIEKQEPNKLKFSKIFVQDVEEINQAKEILVSIVSQIENVKQRMIEEEDRGQQYESIRNQLKRDYIDFKKKTEDLKVLTHIISKQEGTVNIKESGLRREQIYLENEVYKGEDRLSKENDTLMEEIGQKKEIQKEIRHEVSKAYKRFSSDLDIIQQCETQAQQLEEEIKRIDYELELKRLAKIDSQRVLLEIEEIRIISQSYIGKGYRTDKEVQDVCNLEYWVKDGRNLIIEHITMMGGNGDINYLYELLLQQTQELANEQFTLPKFLLRLSNFFNYCDGNVKNIIDILIKIYQYEVLNEQLTLKNRHQDLSLVKQKLKFEIRDQQYTIISAQKQESVTILYQYLENNNNQVIETSIVSVEPTIEPAIKQLCRTNQLTLWRLLIFLTNGLYRWVELLKRLGNLVQQQSSTILLCQNFNLYQPELFSEKFQEDLHQQLKSTINTELDNLYAYANPQLKVAINIQKQRIHANIKNNFILYNWGDIDKIKSLLQSKIKEFGKMKENLSEAQKERAYKEVVENFSTSLFDSFDSVELDAFKRFQDVTLKLISRFIDVFNGIKQLTTVDKVLLKEYIISEGRGLQSGSTQPEYLNQSEIQDGESKLSHRQENNYVIKGLFGMDLDFKQQATIKKCLVYEQFKDDKGLPIAEELLVLRQEGVNLINVYNQTRDKIQDMQEINIIRKVESEKLERERQLKKIKHYMTKTSRNLKSEDEMSYLIKLGKQLFNTNNLNSARQEPRLQLTKTQDIISALHHTYTTFHSKQRKFKQDKTPILIPTPKHKPMTSRTPHHESTKMKYFPTIQNKSTDQYNRFNPSDQQPVQPLQKLKHCKSVQIPFVPSFNTPKVNILQNLIQRTKTQEGHQSFTLK